MAHYPKGISIMEKNLPSSRKKFILGVFVLSVLGSLLRPFSSRKEIIGCGQPVNKKQVMLTEDGQLVEIDRSIKAKGEKITDHGLQSWIKKT